MSSTNSSTSGNTCSDDIPIETISDLQKISIQFPLLLVHQITSTDLEILSTHKQPFAIAWYGEPFTGRSNNLQKSFIRTLKNIPHKAITIEPLNDQIQRYPDLKKKIIQYQLTNFIKNSDLRTIPQWYQCHQCKKWRVIAINTQNFLQKQPNNWICSMGNTHCSFPQTQPTDSEYSHYELQALTIQRDLRKEERFEIDIDWIKVAHHILDTMIRKFDHYLLPFMHAIFSQHNYYQSNERAISITKLKYLLENNKIISFKQFVLALTNMWRNAMMYYKESDPIHQRAIFLHQYCVNLIQQLKIPSQIHRTSILNLTKIVPHINTNNIVSSVSNINRTNNNNNTNNKMSSIEPLIVIRTEHQTLINQPLPPLEKEAVDVVTITSDSDDINATISDIINVDDANENETHDSDHGDVVQNKQSMDVDQNTSDKQSNSTEDRMHVSNQQYQNLCDTSAVQVEKAKRPRAQNKNRNSLCNLFTNSNPVIHVTEINNDTMDIVDENENENDNKNDDHKSNVNHTETFIQPSNTNNRSNSNQPLMESTKNVNKKQNKTKKATKQKKKSPLPKLNLQVRNKPSNINSVKNFENILVTPIIAEKINKIIITIGQFDPEQHFFKEVTHNDYDTVVKRPIHFGQISDKLNANKYNIIGDIVADFNLLWSNCYAFNGKPDKTQSDLRGFSNFAHELEDALNEYMKRFTRVLALRGYITDNTLNEIGGICSKLCLGAVTTNRIYHHRNRLHLYREIESHFERYTVEEFKTFIVGQPSNYCRDMKNGMNVKGPIVPTKAMKKTIMSRFEECKQMIVRSRTLAQRMRKRRSQKRQVLKVKACIVEQNNISQKQFDENKQQMEMDGEANGNDHDHDTHVVQDSSISNSISPFNLKLPSKRNRSCIIVDSDSDTISDQISIHNNNNNNNNMREVMSELHEYPMKGPYMNQKNDMNWCCDNLQCTHTKPGVYKNYNIPYWISTKLSHQFYLCNGCIHSNTLGKIQYITDCDGDKIRLGLDCPFSGCNAALHVLNGCIHENCLGNKQMIRCNHCKNIISNRNDLLYYHCIDGCLNYNSVHSHQYYLCEMCAEKYCHSPQKYIAEDGRLPFYGVWISFDYNKNTCDVMIILQDSNRIALQLIGGKKCRKNNVIHGTIQKNIVGERNKILIEMDNKSYYKHAIWQYKNDSDIRMEFINKLNNNQIYHKILPKCNHCECDMLFLYKNTYPNKGKGNNNNIQCSHNMNQYDPMKYLALKAINYVFFHDNVTKNEFYFYCIKCKNNYSICAGCVLIQHEIEMNQKHIDNEFNIKKKKMKMNENNINNDDKNELILENEKVKKLNDKLRAMEASRDFYKQKYIQLSKAMNTILTQTNND